MQKRAYLILLLNIDAIYNGMAGNIMISFWISKNTCSYLRLILLNSKKITIFIVALDCTSLPTFVNGNHSGKGCSGAVWKDGRPSKQYCVNDAKFPWWQKCCKWHEGNCIPKRDPVSSNAISPNAISLKSGILILRIGS